MTDKAAYEAIGIRADGSWCTVEILGYQAIDEAMALARHYADLWERRVDLYRVPFLSTSSAAWAEDEMQFVCRVLPAEAAAPR